MHVICVDGRMVECESFRAIDSGVLLFEADDEDHQDAIGFIPHGQLQYVLPDEAVQQPDDVTPEPHQQPPQQYHQHATGNVQPR